MRHPMTIRNAQARYDALTPEDLDTPPELAEFDDYQNEADDREAGLWSGI